MSIENIENIQFDYYSNTPSYVKIILDMIPENMVSVQKKMYIKRLYNHVLNNCDAEEIGDIITLSSMFREKVRVTNQEETSYFVEHAYELYIEKMIDNLIYFDMLNECVKSYVGYLSLENKVDNKVSLAK